MDKKKGLIFQIVICIFIVAIVFLAAILNAYSFMNSSVEAVGDNKAVILSQIKGSLEYGLRYGKQLENYFGIEDIFDKANEYCEADSVYITDNGFKLLYGENPPEGLEEKAAQMDKNGDERILWTDGDTQNILLTIDDAFDRAGYIGIVCSTRGMKNFSRPYVHLMYVYALIESFVGIALFLLFFRFFPHRFQKNRLKYLIMISVIIINITSVIPIFFILNSGYRALSVDVADSLLSQNADDIENLISEGVMYSDMSHTEEYFGDIADSSEQISSMELTDNENSGGVVRRLAADGDGREMFLIAHVSDSFIAGKVRNALINTLVTTVTAIMISIEILTFLLGILIGGSRDRISLRDNSGRQTIEDPGLVRGLSFFFSAFRYMAAAFMTIVLAEIYRPVYIFGHMIPYEILMSLPLSGQVFISMITSYMSGIIINKYGWKKTCLFGVVVMIVGTFLSAFAKTPIPFIVAQMVVGTGLGFAKMGIDIYSVAVAAEEDMAMYTAGSNAGAIVGFSCSAALGALVASIFGYSGAYIVMSVLGIGVLLLVISFGMNVAPRKEGEKAEKTEEKEQTKFDLRFPAYILLVIIPYFFILMFVDYFFPVYANSEGITTDAIGYVMLIYGIVTAYIGTPLCPRLTRRLSAALLMPVILLVLAGSLFLFSVHNIVLMAALIVALIGVADGIMPSAQFMYVYDLPFSKSIGFSKALGIEGFFSSMIGAAAPVIFGIVMMYGNGGLALISILISICAVVFMFLNGFIKKGGKKAAAAAMCMIIAASFVFGTVNASSAPASKGDKEKLKIGYCQGGAYYEFDYQIYQIGMALAENGELKSDDLMKLKQGDDAGVVWKAMCDGESDYYIFDRDSFIDTEALEYAGMSDEARSEKFAAIIEENDIDLMITMGTSAGLAIKECCDVPYMNFIASDPVTSEITGGEEFSGDKRAWAHVNSGVEEKALAVMDDIFNPSKLGIIYSDEDPEAYIYSGAASLDEYADKNRKKVVTQYVTDEYDDTEEAYRKYKENMLEAHNKLVEAGIDVYILTPTTLELGDFEEMLEPFVKSGIPVFSLNSTEDVRCGALAAVEMFDYQNIGRFAADIMKRYREGTSLDKLEQQYVTPPYLVLNIDTLRRTGMKMPIDTLISASKIYGKYEGE